MSDDERSNDDVSDTEPINSRAHKKLLDGVARMHTSQHIRKASRSEPAIKRSEFHLAKTSVADSVARRQAKVNVSDLLGVLDKTSKHVQIGKALKKVSNKKNVLNKPLEKPAAEKLKRAINYEKTKEKLERWDAIVATNRSTDHIAFPLNQDLAKIEFKDSYQIPSQFRIKSDLMHEMEAIEPEIFQIGNPNIVDEEEARKKLTREEMLERSRELRRLRMKESQQSAKSHRQNKIKSKKFHRILKKEKIRQQIKEFEQLQKTDPEAALRKIEQLDRNRVEERANLRHRNTGTWAKNLQVRAKYDKDVRKELADQIAISRELTAKQPLDESDDEENGGTANPEDDPDHDPFNPWLKSSKNENGGGEIDDFVSGYRQYWVERNVNEENVKNYRSGDVDVHAEEAGDQDNDSSAEKLQKVKKNPLVAKPSKRTNVNAGWIEEDLGTTDDLGTSPKEPAKKRKKSKVADNLDDLFDDAEDELKEKFSQKAKTMQSELNKNGKQNKKSKTAKIKKPEEHMDLSFKRKNKRPIIDEALDEERHTKSSKIEEQIKKAQASASSANAEADTENINPDKFPTVKPKHLKTALPDTIYTNDDDGFFENDDDDYENSEEKRLTIAEAFEDDDIVADFEREKEDEAKKNGPQEIDLSLPGWGSWGGSGIDPSKQMTKRRLILKFPAQEKRKPENQGNVVIVENADEKMKKHRVSNLPFPFTSVADYEQSIRAPIGSDFVPATAHRLLTKPAVTTRLGTVIKPMNENMLVKKPNRPTTKTGKKISKFSKSK